MIDLLIEIIHYHLVNKIKKYFIYQTINYIRLINLKK
jgi:hypothetical protein